MKKTVLIFGLISGLVSGGLMLATVPFIYQIGFDRGTIVGYTAITASFLLVFFGIRSYRENVGGGRITFLRALGVGFLITLISCFFYTATWEIVYHNFMPDFVEKFSAYSMDKVRSSGASAEAIAKKQEEVDTMKLIFASPIKRVLAIYFIEPFPVGLLVTVISSLILRRRKPAPTSPPAGASA